MLLPLQGTLAPLTVQRNVFDPLSLSPWLWLDASQGVEVTTGVPATDTDTVQRWLDQSGNGAHATQATSGNRLTYKTSVVNNRPVLRSPGSKQMRGVYPVAVTNASLSIFCVMAATGTARHTLYGHEAVAGDGASFSNLEWAVWTDAPNRIVTFQNPGTGASALQTNQTVSGFNVHATNLNGTTISQFVNNVQIASNASGGGAVSRTSYLIAARTVAANAMIGDIAELMVFPLLSSTNRDSVARYLGEKYNIAVS